MIIDERLPEYEHARIEHIVVDADPAEAYRAVLEADLGRAYEGSPVLRVVIGLREAPAAIARRLRGEAPPAPVAWRIDAIGEEGEWVKLGEDPGAELVFGAIGRFWGREISWERIRASEFEGFERPGYGKVAASFSVRGYGAGRSLLSYEARTRGTDASASRAIGRYWWLVGPGIGVVLRGALRYIKSLAERP